MPLPDIKNEQNRRAIKSMIASLHRNGIEVSSGTFVEWPALAESEGRIQGFQFAPPNDPDRFIIQISGESNLLIDLNGGHNGYRAEAHELAKRYYKIPE